MANVYLRIDGGREIVDLPPVCMKCGAPATVRKNKQFSWLPPWVGGLAIIPLAYIIVAAVVTKRQRVETTFCDQHQSYWWLFPLVMWLTALGVVGFGVVAWIGALAAMGPGNESLAAVPCVALALGVLALAIVGIIMGNSRIRPKEITDRYIFLTGVSQEFADAVEEDEDQQRRAFDRDDDDRRSRRQRDDDRPRRPRDDDPRYTR